MIKLLYFASLRETVGQSSEDLELPSQVTDIAALRALLAARGGAWKAAFDGGRLLASVNQQMADDHHLVADGDEVAFFPPVTGG